MRNYIVIFKDDTYTIIKAKDMHDAWKTALQRFGMVLSVDVWD